MSRFRLAGVPTRAARWSATHPWRAIGLWFAFVAIAVSLAATISTENPADADYRVGQSGRAEAMIEDAGLEGVPTENVLVTAPDGGAVDPAAGTEVAADLTHELSGVKGVEEVGQPVASEDGEAFLVPIILTSDDVDAGPIVEGTDAVTAAHPDLDIAQAGEITLDDAINDRVGEDLAAAEFISLPITLVLMLLAFGALIAAGLPVLLAATSVAATIGIIAPISHFVPADLTVSSMIVLIGMAVGVDYSLFYLKRERQEREAGRSTLDAVAIAAETSGHAILVSGGAVIASVGGLFILTDPTFNSLAVGSIIVVAVAVLGSITVLPALLVKFGRWVDRPRVPLLWRLNKKIGRGGISSRLLKPVVRHPVAALLIAAVGVGALAVPALSLKTHAGNLETLPTDIAEVQTFRALGDHFPNEGTTADVVVSGEPGDRDRMIAALEGLATDAGSTSGFTATATEVDTSADGSTSVVHLAIPYDESDERATDAIEQLRDDLAPAALEDLSADWAVGGDAAESLDSSAQESSRLPFLLGFVLLLTFLMMAASFRSIMLGAISTVLNLASVGVAFGMLAIVFQHGVGADLLGFTSPGFVIDWVPIFVLVVLVGLSMDYHVFVISRIRELVATGMPTREAVHRGVADTAGVVTSAAAVMVAVFSIFATMSLLEMKMLGVGLAAAILIDATVIRLVVLPAVLVLLGDRAWWPSMPKPAASLPPAEQPDDLRQQVLVAARR